MKRFDELIIIELAFLDQCDFGGRHVALGNRLIDNIDENAGQYSIVGQVVDAAVPHDYVLRPRVFDAELKRLDEFRRHLCASEQPNCGFKVLETSVHHELRDASRMV